MGATRARRLESFDVGLRGRRWGRDDDHVPQSYAEHGRIASALVGVLLGGKLAVGVHVWRVLQLLLLH